MTILTLLTPEFFPRGHARRDGRCFEWSGRLGRLFSRADERYVFEMFNSGQPALLLPLGVSLDPLRCTNYLPGGLSLSQADKSREILCMCRERDGDRRTVYAGLRRGLVQAFDTSERRFTVECDVTGGLETLVGVAKHGRCV